MLGCDNREIFLAARDTYDDDTDVAVRLVKNGNEEESEGKIAALFGESFFHSGGQIVDDGLEDEDVYVDLGDDRLDISIIRQVMTTKDLSSNSFTTFQQYNVLWLPQPFKKYFSLF